MKECGQPGQSQELCPEFLNQELKQEPKSQAQPNHHWAPRTLSSEIQQEAQL